MKNKGRYKVSSSVIGTGHDMNICRVFSALENCFEVYEDPGLNKTYCLSFCGAVYHTILFNVQLISQLCLFVNLICLPIHVIHCVEQGLYFLAQRGPKDSNQKSDCITPRRWCCTARLS